MLATSLTHVTGAIASFQTFTFFTFVLIISLITYLSACVTAFIQDRIFEVRYIHIYVRII